MLLTWMTAKYLKETGLFQLVFLFGSHILGLLYLLKFHTRIFKYKPTSMKALLFSLIGFGFGQVYNLQFGKGIGCFALFALSVLYVKSVESEPTTLQSILFLLAFILLVFGSPIDALNNAKSARFRKMKADQKIVKDLTMKTKILTILKLHNEGHEFAVDTNILMHEEDLLLSLLERDVISLTVCKTVLDELDGLKNSPDADTRKRAQRGFDIVEAYQRKGLLVILEPSSYQFLKSHMLDRNADQKIIGTYLEYFEKKNQKILFLSNDKGARITARNVGLPVAEMNLPQTQKAPVLA